MKQQGNKNDHVSHDQTGCRIDVLYENISTQYPKYLKASERKQLSFSGYF